MTNLLLDISGKIDKKYLDAISEIKEITDSNGIHFFLIGATARDFIFEHFYDIKAPRVTTDIDLGMKVNTWDDFITLEKIILQSGMFQKDIKR